MNFFERLRGQFTTDVLMRAGIDLNAPHANINLWRCPIKIGLGLFVLEMPLTDFDARIGVRLPEPSERGSGHCAHPLPRARGRRDDEGSQQADDGLDWWRTVLATRSERLPEQLRMRVSGSVCPGEARRERPRIR